MENNKNISRLNKFREAHKDKLREYIICSVCDHKYKYFGKSKHNKTKVHLCALKMIEKYKKQD